MPSIEFELDQGIGIIRLNRPEKLNSFNREMAFLLQKYLDDAATNKEIRTIYLTGNGKGFSAGQDLSEVTGPNAVGFDKILSENYNPIVIKIRNIPKPVVCAVNGTAAGAGANIALCCDIVVASQSASFIQAFSKIGLIPDCGGSFFLPRLIGWQKASALAMLGDKVTAEEAERMGMIYKVYPDAEFIDASMQIAARLAMMPTLGLGYTKKALNASMSNGLEDQLREEDILQQIAAQTVDYREGVNAFMEKRQPRFKGE